MITDVFTSVLSVEVNGTPLPDPLAALLIDGWVDTSVTVPAAFRLSFLDPGAEVLRKYPQLAVGAEVKLRPVAAGRRGDPLLTGDITGLEVDADANGRTVVVRGYDPGHRLLRNRRVERFPGMKASDIVRKVATAARLRIGTIDATKAVYDLATQPNVTDWDFLTRLARENDVRLFFDGDGKLQFTALKPASGAPPDSTPARQSPYVLEFGVNTLWARAGVTAAGQVETVSARGWDVQTKRALTAAAPATNTQDVEVETTPGKLAQPFGRAELVDTLRPYTAQAQVKQAADALAHDVAGSFAELEIEVVGNPELMPGVPVAVKGSGSPFEGRWTVTGARHIFRSGRQYTTRVTVSGRQFRSLYGLTSDGAAEQPAMPGVVQAKVTNIKDPDNRFRVKVEFPWLSGTYESDWCRVAQLGRGLVLPEVGDEVLVAFDRGSLEHPYVLAGLYNGVDKPIADPDKLPAVDPTGGDVNWRSFASPSGHLVELVDARTKRRSGIRLQTADGKLKVHLDQSETTVTIDSRGKIEIKGSRGIDIDAGTGNLRLSGTTVDISAKTNLNISGGLRVGINSRGAVMIDALASAQMKSAGPLLLATPTTATVNAAVSLLLNSALPLRNTLPF